MGKDEKKKRKEIQGKRKQDELKKKRKRRKWTIKKRVFSICHGVQNTQPTNWRSNTDPLSKLSNHNHIFSICATGIGNNQVYWELIVSPKFLVFLLISGTQFPFSIKSHLLAFSWILNHFLSMLFRFNSHALYLRQQVSFVCNHVHLSQPHFQPTWILWYSWNL